MQSHHSFSCSHRILSAIAAHGDKANTTRATTRRNTVTTSALAHTKQKTVAEKNKRLLKALISKLGQPCSQQCAGEEGINGKECRGQCKQRKMHKIKGFLDTLKKKTQHKLAQKKATTHTLMAQRDEAKHDDDERKQASVAFFAPPFAKNKPSTRYPAGLVDIFGGSRPAIRSDVFQHSHELYCDGTDGSAVGPDGTVTGPPLVDPDEAAHLCAMCGGNKVLLWSPLQV